MKTATCTRHEQSQDSLGTVSLVVRNALHANVVVAANRNSSDLFTQIPVGPLTVTKCNSVVARGVITDHPCISLIYVPLSTVSDEYVGAYGA